MKTILAVLMIGTAACAQGPFSWCTGFCDHHPGLVLPPAWPTFARPSPPYDPPTVATPLYNSCVPTFSLPGGPGAASPFDACQRNDNDSTAALPIGFTFDFFGQAFTEVFINNNGNLTFGIPVHQGTPTAFPAAGLSPMIAPFWADVDTRGYEQNPPVVTYGGRSGTVWAQGVVGTENRFIVTWDHVGFHPGQADKLNTFQVILTDGTDPVLPFVPGTNRRYNVGFFYNDMQWTTGGASGGVGGLGGTGAVVGVSLNGMNCPSGSSCTHLIGQFDQIGNMLAAGGVDWLDWRAIHLDLTVNPPVVSILPQKIDPGGYIIVSEFPGFEPIGSGGDLILTNPILVLPHRRGVGPVFNLPASQALVGKFINVQYGISDPFLLPLDPIQLSPGITFSLRSPTGYLPSTVAVFNGGSAATLDVGSLPALSPSPYGYGYPYQPPRAFVTIGDSVVFHVTLPGF